MPVMFLQQSLRIRIWYFTEILTPVIQIVRKRFVRMQLPENAKDLVPSKGISEREDPVSIAGWIDHRDDMKSSIVSDVHKVLLSVRERSA